jgi:hypothetical protein
MLTGANMLTPKRLMKSCHNGCKALCSQTDVRNSLQGSLIAIAQDAERRKLAFVSVPKLGSGEIS